MKKIKIPAPIILNDSYDQPLKDESGNPVIITFKSFVGSTLLIDPKFGKTLDDILSAVEIKAKLAIATTELEIENSDWEKLYAISKEPTNNYNPAVVMQVISFLTSIRDAK